MPQAPAADQKRLLDVQDADTRLAQARHRKANLPVLAQIEELSGRLADLTHAHGLVTIEVSDLKRELAKAEDDVETVRARAQRDNERLASGQGTPKDLQALQAEVAILTKRQADLEDIQVDAMERLEAAEARAESARAQVAAIREQITALEAERDQEFTAIDHEIGDLEAVRHASAQGIDAGLMALYEKLRAGNGGVGAATLLHGQCQGCHMKLNPVDLARIESAGADDIVRCEECSRILVRGARA